MFPLPRSSPYKCFHSRLHPSAGQLVLAGSCSRGQRGEWATLGTVSKVLRVHQVWRDIYKQLEEYEGDLAQGSLRESGHWQGNRTVFSLKGKARSLQWTLHPNPLCCCVSH